MSYPEPNISVKVDVTNPGQFFACCGLLELADRLWPGAEGWFDPSAHLFHLHCDKAPAVDCPRALIDRLDRLSVANTMATKQVERREALHSLPKKERARDGLEDEKKALDKLWRESPVLLGEPFALRIDWFLDDYAGGSAFKTWAGQQSVIDIASAMKAAFVSADLCNLPPEEWLFVQSDDGSIPFNFDAALGNQGSDLDIGFSLDPLNISSAVRPMIEFLAFVGLQRFRPMRAAERNTYRYFAWPRPLACPLAAVACAGALALPDLRLYEFRLLFRTKYLKSFLPATPVGENTWLQQS